jgi:hypothetical protein
MQTPSLHGHVRLPLRVRKKPSHALRHRRTASCADADTYVGQLQKLHHRRPLPLTNPESFEATINPNGPVKSNIIVCRVNNEMKEYWQHAAPG